MIAQLRLLLLGLVMLNLGFVQLTGAVGLQWMLGLWLGAATAPLLVRWHDRLLYRGLWNGTVLASFAFLVNDALTSGLLHMLEDGLLLAALCQVHLLNNVGQRQRPDLLFFNSFLIAFVTSFFCADLSWSLCFCGYAALLVPSLQLFVVLPRTGTAEPGAVRSLLQNGLPRSAIAIAVTALVFAFWPRNFHREGWIGDALQLGGPPMVAFADEVRLDRQTTPTLSDAEVLRVRGDRARMPTHWRGVTFVTFDGGGWQPYRVLDFGTRGATDPAWQAVTRMRWSRPFAPRGVAMSLHLLDHHAGRLFLPVDACDVELPDELAPVLLDPKADGIIALDDYDRDEDVLQLAIRVGNAPAPLPLSPRARSLLCGLPQRVPRALTELAATLRGELPTDATPDAVADHAREWLASHRRYALPGTPGAARTLDDFLLGTGGGHCEYFATTLALLLRLQKVPCRVAGGYLGHEWDEVRDELVVRQRDAHAWVEILSPVTGWTTLDATPGDVSRTAAAGSWWDELVTELQRAWGHVAGFGDEDRRALFAWLLALPAAGMATTMAHPIATALLLLVAGSWWRWHRRHRAARVPATIRRLRAALRRVRIDANDGETPREWLQRAKAKVQQPDDLAELVAAVAEHEADRYAIGPPTATAMAPASRGGPPD